MKYNTRDWNKHAFGKYGDLTDLERESIRKRIQQRNEQIWILTKVIEAFPNELEGERIRLLAALVNVQLHTSVEKIREEFISYAKELVTPELIDKAITNAENMVALGFRI